MLTMVRAARRHGSGTLGSGLETTMYTGVVFPKMAIPRGKCNPIKIGLIGSIRDVLAQPLYLRPSLSGTLGSGFPAPLGPGSGTLGSGYHPLKYIGPPLPNRSPATRET